MAEALLEVRDLVVRYGAVPAVRDLSLTIDRGEIVGLIGPNGAGKSTTLLALMGVIPPYRGEITFAGRPLRGMRTEAIVRSGISLVPEGRHIFAGLTVEENLRLGLVGRRDTRNLQADLEWVYGLFPVVRDFRARQASALSGGQQQQLAIARALLASPDLLVLDEPSLGLAPTVVDILFGALASIRDRVTILLVEQRAQRTVAFADRTYVLSNGTLRMTLTPADAGDEAKMVAAYFS